ncbi:MAG: alpha/beta hydrolase [Eubacteriales bacterium]|jgi:acetyl esterase/lipase
MKLYDYNLHEINPNLPQTVNPAHVQVLLRENSARIGTGIDMRRPVVINFPGGGYAHLSERESDPVSLQFSAAGFQALTVYYSCTPDRYPVQLLQAAAVVAWVRQHADELLADPENIYVCGFSAGGHLAASTGILWKEPVISETLGVDAKMCRPDGMILGYPVITYGTFANPGSFHNLLGKNQPPQVYEKLSLQTRVDDTTPPAFLWHTFSDDAVPLENTLMLASALRAHMIPFELHIFPDGPHGLSVANTQSSLVGSETLINPHVSEWMKLAVEWVRLQSHFE